VYQIRVLRIYCQNSVPRLAKVAQPLFSTHFGAQAVIDTLGFPPIMNCANYGESATGLGQLRRGYAGDGVALRHVPRVWERAAAERAPPRRGTELPHRLLLQPTTNVHLKAGHRRLRTLASRYGTPQVYGTSSRHTGDNKRTRRHCVGECMRRPFQPIRSPSSFFLFRFFTKDCASHDRNG